MTFSTHFSQDMLGNIGTVCIFALWELWLQGGDKSCSLESSLCQITDVNRKYKLFIWCWFTKHNPKWVFGLDKQALIGWMDPSPQLKTLKLPGSFNSTPTGRFWYDTKLMWRWRWRPESGGNSICLWSEMFLLLLNENKSEGLVQSNHAWHNGRLGSKTSHLIAQLTVNLHSGFVFNNRSVLNVSLSDISDSCALLMWGRL